MAINGAWDSDVSTDFTFANGDRDATSTSATALCIGTDFNDVSNGGKFYFEVTAVNIADTVGEFAAGLATSPSLGDSFVVVFGNGDVSGIGNYPGLEYVEGDIICVAMDYGNSAVYFRVNNGQWNGDEIADPTSGSSSITEGGNYPAFGSVGQASNVARINTGTVAFSYTAPSGYSPWYGSATSPIAGASTVAFSTAGTLRGSGRLAGTSSPTFSTSGTMRGAGVLSGASSVAFTTAGNLKGTGALSGTSSFAFSNSGFLRLLVPVTGTSTVAFSTSGNMIAVGLLAGTSTVTFSTSGTLLGLASLSGSSSTAFSTSGTLVGTGTLTGSSNLTFSTSASGMLFGFISGSTTSTFSLSGDMVGNFGISGSASFSFSTSGNISFSRLPYEITFGPYPDAIYETGSGSGPFLYYETSGTYPDDIYEEN